MSIKVFRHLMCACLICFSQASNSALVSRLGGQAYYDTVLDITWLTNANLAQTETFGVSGIQSDGSMSWFAAHDWLNALNSSNYLGVNNWRMPTVNPVNGSTFNYEYRNDGTSDYGNNISAPGTFYVGSIASEMAYMYYSNMNGVSMVDLNGNANIAWGVASISPFINVITEPNDINGQYWTGTTFGLSPDSAFDFYFDHGGQAATMKDYTGNYVWAVLDGDIGLLTPVPVPAAIWLFVSGLIGLIGFARKKNK